MVANISAAWFVLFYAIYTSQIALVIAPVLSFIVMMFGLYAGVGHMDLRTMIDAGIGSNTTMTTRPNPEAFEDPVPPEPPEPPSASSEGPR